MLHFPRWQVITIVVVCVLGVLLSLPNFFSEKTLESLPGWVPHKQVSLGLDLQGGSHLLLEVNFGAAFAERMNGVVDGVRAKMRDARIGYTGLNAQGDTVVFTVRDKDRLADIPELMKQVDPDIDVRTSPDGQVTLRYNERAVQAAKRAMLEQSIEIVRRRIDELGTKESTVQRQGEDRILVQVPGVDPERLKSILGKTAKMTFRLVDTQVSVEDARRGRLPPGDEILPSEEGTRGARTGGEAYVVQKRVMVSGDMLTDAQATFNNNEPVVSFKFNSVGGRRFCDATRENVGKPFAIVLDNKVISAPVIREAICQGSGIISGSFTVQSANDLALLLRAGALPAPLVILEERSVGPDLGADSIRAGTTACIVGVVLVVLFMFVFYGLFGLFADIALVFNLALMLAALSVIGATLTLPGIAGIALTLGMAVDANVLIYERIREELRSGRTMLSSLDAGFKRAFGTILDSHVTTLVAGALLFWLGSGPVKGFAVTLSIGVIISLFSAILITRLLIVWWLQRMRPKAIPI
jgi:protein-export membrane protein SecD